RHTRSDRDWSSDVCSSDLGKVYIQTTRHLYCFGKKGNNPGLAPESEPEKWPAPGAAKSLQIIPSEVTLRPGRTASFHARSIDARSEERRVGKEGKSRSAPG